MPEPMGPPDQSGDDRDTADAGAADAAPRRRRADAQRNIDALLEAAKSTFAASGVDAPSREIAARAGVGVGTLYRHFPQRSDLVKAVFRREVDACAAAAPVLAAANPPDQALTKWLYRFTEFIAAKQGLAAALHSGDPAFAALPAYFQQNLGPALEQLLAAARQAGAVRRQVDADDLLDAVAMLCRSGPAGPTDRSQRMVGLLIDGLRVAADAPAPS